MNPNKLGKTVIAIIIIVMQHNNVNVISISKYIPYKMKNM